MKQWKRVLVFLLLQYGIFGVFFCSHRAEAAGRAEISNGNIIFETVDTKASTNVRWMTAGFTIRRDLSHGNPLKNGKYAVIYLQPDFQSIEEQKGGTYRITYTIPKKKADRALLRAGLDEIKDGDRLYFNTIFKIKAYDVVQGRQYYRLDDIKRAAGWKNPDDFEEHFDIGVKFNSGKYPVTLEYRTASGELIKKKKVGEWKAGKEVSVNIDGKIVSGGREYVLYKSYCIHLSKPSQKKQVILVPERDYGTGHSQGDVLKIQGMRIVAKMKIKPPPPDEPEETEDEPQKGKPPVPVEVIEKKIMPAQIQSKAKIEAEKKGSEAYDAKTAIPSGEKLYVEGSADAALMEYKFTRYEGSVVYHVNIRADYILKWQTVSNGKKVWNYRTVDGDRTVYVERKYSYWTVDYFNYYTADGMKVENEVFPSGEVFISNPSGDAEITYKSTAHSYPLIKEKTVQKGNYVQNVSSGSSPPSYIDYEEIARQEAAAVKTANDFLAFMGETILEDTEAEEKTEAPVLPEDAYGDKVFYLEGLKIADEKKNDEYISRGEISYKRKASAVLGVSSEDAMNAAPELVYEIEEINPVVVFTPVVCHGKVTDKSSFCQSVSPNPARCQLVADTEFSAAVSTYGSHQDYKGYGTRDYGKFTKGIEVCIPFDVYQENVFYPAGTWHQISGTAAYYIPIWVESGLYTVSFRAAAKNGGFDMAGMEEANLDPEYSQAVSHVPVEVSGRMYGLKLYDITDYPLWETVFRKENSSKLSGIAYYVGTKNQNGIDTGLNPVYTLPVVEGSHPFYRNTGYLKAGYLLRGSLKTIGDFYHEEDKVEIIPEFYFVDKNGENRKKVDLYYNESVAGKYQSVIRVGSERDRNNIRSVTLGAGGLSVENQELADTAFVKGTGIGQIQEQEMQWMGFQDLRLTSLLQTFQGVSHMMGRNKRIPEWMDRKKVMRAKQNWYFEYYLPAEYHITEQGYPVEEYAKQYPIDFREDFWEKEGFLILNFRIYAERGNEKRLSYTNENREYCNMWKMEGYYYERTDENGVSFHLQDGDFAVFYYGKRQSDSAGEDYTAGGTH